MKTNPELLRLFQVQHGVAAISQLCDLDIDRSSVWRSRRRRDLLDILPGIVRLASAPETFETRAMAAQLQAAPDGFLCGFTAGRIRGMRDLPSQRISTMIPRRLPGDRARCHQRTPLPRWVDRSESNWHDERDVDLLGPFRVERAESMLFTIASRTNDYRFERIAEKAWNLKIITPQGMAEYVEEYRRRGRSGVARVVRWLDNVGIRTRPMQSDFEVDVLDAVRRLGLPEPLKQYPLVVLSGETLHLDLAWPAARLAVEPGHTVFHHGEMAVARDAARDLACHEVGVYVKRFTEHERENLAGVGRAIQLILEHRLAS